MNNRRALVCGSSKGIGASTAIELSKLGTSIVLLARDEKSLSGVLDKLDSSNNQKHTYLIADFDNPNELKKRMNEFVNDKPPVNILINNSGGPKPGPIIDANVEDFINAFNRHLICNHILTQTLLEGMKLLNYGRIINIISTSVKEPIQGLGVSNTIRGAVASWAKTLSIEVGKYGITINNILPGFTDTDRLTSLIKARSQSQGISEEDISMGMKKQVPLGRFGSSEETAKAIAFLASSAAGYINGVSLAVDGGRLSSI